MRRRCGADRGDGGQDLDGNDPAEDAQELPPALRFLQEHPPVFRMEKADLSEADSVALVAAMDGLMNDREIIDFHHFELCHLDEQFFTEHDVFVDRMEAQVRGVSPALQLPFGRLPWHEPGSPIPDAYAVWSDIAEDFYAVNAHIQITEGEADFVTADVPHFAFPSAPVGP